MSTELNLGALNGHSVGRILKEAVRRATVVIRTKRATFEAHVKESYSGSMDDVFTDADGAAQEIYLRTIRECFPGCGIIAEEDSLKVEPSGGITAYFTVDPLDGTKAFVRRQSHGVGTMIALVDEGEVIAAYIGDINTEEVYGYRPQSGRVHRITRLDAFEELRFASEGPLNQNYALLRDPPDKFYGGTTRCILRAFKNYNVDGGSIGTWAARLWKGEVRALLIPPGYETPWDSTPVFGISKKLGYRFLRPIQPMEEIIGWEIYEPRLPTEKYRREHDLLIIHKNDIAELINTTFVTTARAA